MSLILTILCSLHSQQKLFSYFSQERQKYYKHAENSRRHPHKYACIIIDGMDQNKTNIPHFVRIPNTVANVDTKNWWQHICAHFCKNVVNFCAQYSQVIFICANNFPKVNVTFVSIRFSQVNGMFSPLCLMWVRAQHWQHVRQAKFCVSGGYSRGSPIFAHLLISPSHMS